jgi:iron(III) transport system permease protein
VLIAAERLLRQRSKRWNLESDERSPQLWELRGWRAALAQAVCLLPPLLAMAIPVLWMSTGWRALRSESVSELLHLASRSVTLALAATLVTCTGALLLAILRRWSRQVLIHQFSFIAGLGYAVPGSVLGVGLLIIGGPLMISPLLLLLWGYSDRFMAVSKQGLDAALERLPPSIDESARSLGHSWPSVLGRIHLPLLRGPLLVGGLLVFVDVVKELPLTLALRPFNFDTLAVRVFQYAGDERVEAAMAPALLIMVLGLIASMALIPSLERRD